MSKKATPTTALNRVYSKLPGDESNIFNFLKKDNIDESEIPF